MTFEYKPLEKISGPKPIELYQHPISSIAWLNWVENKLVYLFIERRVGISHELAVSETLYRSPIKTEWPENENFRVRRYSNPVYPKLKHYAVMVLPQRGGGYNAAQLIASYLATNGIVAYEVETPLHGARRPKGKSIDEIVKDFDTLKLIFFQAITEMRGVIDLIEEERIGSIGISLGAIYASIVYGIDERLSSACLVSSAGNLADLIARSGDKLAEHLRHYAILNGIQEEELRDNLKEIEPLNYVSPHKSRNLLMINGTSDKDMPIECALKLAEAWGYPRLHKVKRGHVGMIFEAPKILPMALEHFRRTLK